jgi:hypothetical protein
MAAFAHHCTVAYQHAADAGIGMGRVQAALREFERPRHVTRIMIGEHGG